MFKEQLHTSFDSIRPAPELLDRISAMMSEEAAKPKKPIYMNAVKYGGIAAAVAITAGAAIALTQNGGFGKIATENAAAPVTTAAMAAAETVPAEDGDNSKDGLGFISGVQEMSTEAAATTTTPMFAPENSAYEDIAADNADNAYDAAEEAYLATPAAPETYAGAAGEAEANELPDIRQEKVIQEKAEEKAADESPAMIMAEPNSDAVEEPQLEYYTESCDSVEEYCDDYDAAEAEAEEYPALPEFAIAAGTSDNSNPVTGGFDTMQFEEPFIYQFYTIPETLMKTVDGIIVEETDQWGAHYTVMGEKWREFIGMFAKPTTTPDDGDVPPASADDPPTFRDITAIDEDFNIYTFIEYFNVPDETAREALAGYLTEEQINILLTGDKASVTAEFASGYAIVKGRKIYAPLWLERYSADEWKAAGITQKDIKEKYDMLTNIPYLREDLQEALTRKIDEYLR